MKKALLGVLSTAVVLSLCALTAFAACPGGLCDNTGSRCVYADADGDGLCDNCGAYHRCAGTGSCANFADADGDGLCDNYGSGQSRSCGYGHGHGHGHGSRGGGCGHHGNGGGKRSAAWTF